MSEIVDQRLKNLKPFQPGNRANPGGRPAVPAELKAIKSLSQTEATKLISKYARMNANEIELVMNNEKTALVDLAICSIFKSAIRYGDHKRLAFLFECCNVMGAHAAVDDDREELRKLSLNELLVTIVSKVPRQELLSIIESHSPEAKP